MDGAAEYGFPSVTDADGAAEHVLPSVTPDLEQAIARLRDFAQDNERAQEILAAALLLQNPKGRALQGPKGPSFSKVDEISERISAKNWP